MGFARARVLCDHAQAKYPAKVVNIYIKARASARKLWILQQNMALGVVGTLDYAHSRAGAVAQRASPRVCVKIIDFANLNSHFFALYCNFATRRATNVANDQRTQ